MTSRLRYATHSEFLECFGQQKELYICPFDAKQQNNLIENSVAQFKEMRSIIKEFETLDTAQEYTNFLDK